MFPQDGSFYRADCNSLLKGRSRLEPVPVAVVLQLVTSGTERVSAVAANPDVGGSPEKKLNGCQRHEVAAAKIRTTHGLRESCNLLSELTQERAPARE